MERKFRGCKILLSTGQVRFVWWPEPAEREALLARCISEHNWVYDIAGNAIKTRYIVSVSQIVEVDRHEAESPGIMPWKPVS